MLNRTTCPYCLKEDLKLRFTTKGRLCFFEQKGYPHMCDPEEVRKVEKIKYKLYIEENENAS